MAKDCSEGCHLLPSMPPGLTPAQRCIKMLGLGRGVGGRYWGWNYQGGNSEAERWAQAPDCDSPPPGPAQPLSAVPHESLGDSSGHRGPGHSCQANSTMSLQFLPVAAKGSVPSPHCGQRDEGGEMSAALELSRRACQSQRGRNSRAGSLARGCGRLPSCPVLPLQSSTRWGRRSHHPRPPPSFRESCRPPALARTQQHPKVLSDQPHQ